MMTKCGSSRLLDFSNTWYYLGSSTGGKFEFPDAAGYLKRA